MKRICRILIVVIFLILICCTLKYYSSTGYKQKKYLKINSEEVGKILFEYASPNGFHGDGLEVYVHEMTYNNMIKIKNRSEWYELNKDINQKINISYIDETKNFKFPENGFYLLYDKYNKCFTTIDDYFYSHKYEPYNYIFAVLDFKNENFIYVEEDT